MTHAEVVVWVAGQDALRGNLSAFAELADRSEGRPGVAISLSTDEDPLTAILKSMTRTSKELGPPPEDDEEVVQ